MLVIAIFAASVAVALVAWVALNAVMERAEVRRSLRALDDYQITSLREQQMLEPFGQRVLQPVADSLTNVARRFTPDGYIENTQGKIRLAGEATAFTVEAVLIIKLLGALSVVLWILLFFVILPIGSLLGLLLTAFCWLGSFLAPDVILNRQVEGRKERIRRQLPDVLDLLTISVEAGLGFEQAVDRTAAAVPGELSQEFGRMIGEVRIGSSRAEALRAMDARNNVMELRTFILAMLQADTFGVSISRILRSQSDDMRQRRRTWAQEQAQKAPVKMLFPLVFFIFPSIFIVILGPAVIELLKAF